MQEDTDLNPSLVTHALCQLHVYKVRGCHQHSILRQVKYLHLGRGAKYFVMESPSYLIIIIHQKAQNRKPQVQKVDLHRDLRKPTVVKSMLNVS